jgi:hypothetical protein
MALQRVLEQRQAVCAALRQQHQRLVNGAAERATALEDLAALNRELDVMHAIHHALLARLEALVPPAAPAGDDPVGCEGPPDPASF